MGNDLVKGLSDSLFASGAEDLINIGADITDEVISALSDSACKIPIVGLLVPLCKAVSAVHERHLLQQTLVFIQELNSKTISDNKLRKFREKIDKDPQYASKLLSRVLLLLHRAIDNDKAKILANLFRSYVNGDIEFELYQDLTDITDRLFIADLLTISEAYKAGGLLIDDFPLYHVDRLVAVGLLANHHRVGGTMTIRPVELRPKDWEGVEISQDEEEIIRAKKDILVSSIGDYFCKYGLNL